DRIRQNQVKSGVTQRKSRSVGALVWAPLSVTVLRSNRQLYRDRHISTRVIVRETVGANNGECPIANSRSGYYGVSGCHPLLPIVCFGIGTGSGRTETDIEIDGVVQDGAREG